MSKSRFLLSLALAGLTLVSLGFAQNEKADKSETFNPLPRHYPTKERFAKFARSGGSSLSYHNGPVMTTAYVVPIYWGPSWSGGSDSSIASSLTNFIDGGTTNTTTDTTFGQTGEYNVITQYYQSGPTYIQKSNLGAAGGALFDNSTPPTNVTDADLQAEVVKMVGSPRTDTIYEVFLPASSYSSDGAYTSCGGPNLYYCAYHGNFSHNGSDIKYASMPYPSCGGCASSGFTVTQNFEHFVSHETREAVTDPDGNAWYDRRGYEADDKCAWSPTPFTDSSTGLNFDGSAFAFQYEWSNSAGGCVKTQ